MYKRIRDSRVLYETFDIGDQMFLLDKHWSPLPEIMQAHALRLRASR